MPEDSPVPPPLPRPPVPGWMWAVCGLGMIPVCAVVGGACAAGTPHADVGGFAGGGAFVGFLLGVPMIAGLALAGRLISGTGARLFGAFAFGVLLLVGLGGVAFAGCVCLMTSNNFH